MKAYLINLEQAKDRLTFAEKNFSDSGFELIIVKAIAGDSLELPDERYDEASYRSMHGKSTNPYEVACYFSHMKALAMFIESNDDSAIICEDDVSLDANCLERINAAIRADISLDFLRLTASHRGTPIVIKTLANNYGQLCLNLTKETGAGAYWVNRKAAKLFLKHLRIMKLPFDHAFDREWLWPLSVYSLFPYPIDQTSHHPTQIKASKSYKLPFYRRLRCYYFRMTNSFIRFFYRCSKFISYKINQQN